MKIELVVPDKEIEEDINAINIKLLEVRDATRKLQNKTAYLNVRMTSEAGDRLDSWARDETANTETVQRIICFIQEELAAGRRMKNEFGTEDRILNAMVQQMDGMETAYKKILKIIDKTDKQ